VGVINAALNRIGPGADALSLKRRLTSLEEAKTAALGEIDEQVRLADADLVSVYGRLFAYRRVAPTLRRDVSISIHPLFALTFLSSAKMGLSGVQACAYGVQPWAIGAETSTVNVLQACRPSNDALRQTRECLRARSANDKLVVVLGKSRAYIVGRRSDGASCFAH
jgi:hypothetical protein